MVCKNCNAEIADGSRFCAECGVSLTGAQQAVAAKQDPLIGATIDGKYRIDSQIGAGGMATVYRATRLLIGDQVAVKILHAEQFRDSQAPERFRREAQAAARLKHPNAVTIYDFGVSNDSQVYLVMELVEGKSLRSIIKQQGPFLPSAAAEIITQAAAALDEAHRQNIVHRDVKPDNIIVSSVASGIKVKVLDFGIVRLRDMSAIGNLTQTGSVMGTPHYMSPEQCLGEELDGRSDVYSLGVVLYEMLAGVVPFNSPTSMAVVVQHVNTAPAPLRILNVSIPASVEAVVMRALEKKREARPQTAAVLAEELNAALRGGTLPILVSEPSAGTGISTPGLMATVQIATPWGTHAASQTPANLQRSTVAMKGSLSRGKQASVLAVGLAAFIALSASLGWWMFSKGEGGTPQASAEAGTAPPPATPTIGTPVAVPNSVAPDGLATPPVVEASPVAARGAEAGQLQPGTQAAARSGVNSGPGGGLTIRAQSGSTVVMDGSQVGVTNAEGVLFVAKVQPGRHLLVVRKDGFRHEERTVNFAGQTDVVRIDLNPLPGTLSVTANVQGAAFQLDGAGAFAGQISNLEVTPGRHRVTATKAGFKAATAEVETRPGENIRAVLILDPLSPDDLLAESEKSIQAGDWLKGESGARMVLEASPQHPKGNLLLGQATYGQKRFAESIGHFRIALELGQEVVFPIKHHHAGFPHDGLCTGVVTLTKTTLAFRSTSSGGHDFKVDGKKILEMKSEPEKAARVNVNVSITNGKKEEKRDYNFQNVNAALYDVSTTTTPRLRVGCQRCDDSMNVLYQLLLLVRNSS